MENEVRCPCGTRLLETCGDGVSGSMFCLGCRRRIRFTVRGSEVLVEEDTELTDGRKRMDELKFLSPLDNSAAR